MLLNYHYIIFFRALRGSGGVTPPFGLMLLNYHYIIIFCSRWWLPVGIAGFRLELQAFRLELPLRVGGVTPPFGLMLLNYHYIIFFRALRGSGGVTPPFGLMLLNYHYVIIFCSRWWLPVGIAGFRLELQAFRLELQAFRLELPLRVGGVTPPFGLMLLNYHYIIFFRALRGSGGVTPPFGLMLLNYHYIIFFLL
jgi:hypothetical protein